MQVEAKKEKKKHRIKRAWRSKDKESHSAVTTDDGPKENTARSSSPPPPLENGKDIETGDSVSIGEAGWTPTQRPKIKGKKEKKGSPRGSKKKKKSKDSTEEVLAILLPDTSGPAIAPVEDAVVKKIEKKRKPLDFGKPKRSRALSERVSERSRSSDAHLIAVGSSSEEDSDEESNSSSEEDGEQEVTELDFNNLRKYPKGLLRSFCRSQHIPVEARRKKQLSKQDYINAILAYTKEEKPKPTRKEKERKEKRAAERAANATHSRRTRDSPFASPYGNRFLASSQPTYMPSFMPRGMSEEEMLAMALEESLKEHAKEENRKGDNKVDEGKEREKGEKNDERTVTDVEGGEKEKEKKTELKSEAPVVLPQVKKETPPPHFMSRSLELKNTPKKQEVELDGSQFDSDEAFARALQLQLQREASSESESDDTESDSDDEVIERILDRRGGLMQLLELLAAERGRTLGTLPPYLSNDASLHTGLRIQRSFGSSRYQHQDIDIDKMTYEELLELGEKIGEVKKKGATQSMISGRTQAFKYQPPKVNEERKENSSCPICMTEFEENDEVRMLPCIHLYHKDCVDKWLQLNATCCVCQRKLTEE